MDCVGPCDPSWNAPADFPIRMLTIGAGRFSTISYSRVYGCLFEIGWSILYESEGCEISLAISDRILLRMSVRMDDGWLVTLLTHGRGRSYQRYFVVAMMEFGAHRSRYAFRHMLQWIGKKQSSGTVPKGIVRLRTEEGVRSVQWRPAEAS